MMHCGYRRSVVIFVYVIFFTSCTSLAQSNGHCKCDNPADPNSANACEGLFKLFESALLIDGGNLYKIRHLFFPPSAASPELAQITINLDFDSHSGEGSALPVCPCPLAANDTRLVNISRKTTLRYGLTTIGVYTFIHPALLHQLQPQLPFTIMKLVTPELVPFLWDGCNRLPNISITLSVPVDNLSCIPALSQVNGVLDALISRVRYYRIMIIIILTCLY